MSRVPRHARSRTAGRRASTVVRAALAGGLLVGTGAVASSAAWTDGAWFAASATTPTIELQGGTGRSPATWGDADSSTAAVTIPADTFVNLAPGVLAQAHVGLRNVSSVPLTVPAPVPTWSGDFASGGSCPLGAVTTVTIDGGTRTTLPATSGTTTDVVVSVTPPDAWNGATTCQHRSGTLTLTFTGSTS